MHIAVWMTVFWITIRESLSNLRFPLLLMFLPVIVSLFGTLGFAEEEFWSSCLKLLVVVMFIIIGMCVSAALCAVTVNVV